MEMAEDGCMSFVCEQGHTGQLILHNPRFTILFDFGALAILDGYYRESISSFAAAMERFHEFYVRAVCHSQSVAHDELAKTWKHLSQSERQIGAFAMCHLLDTGEGARLIDAKLTELRNNVIHKGTIATRADAMRYGDGVFRHILGYLAGLEERHPGAIKETARAEAQRSANGAKGAAQVYETIIDVNPSPEDCASRSLEEALEDLAKYRTNVYKP